MGQKVLCLDSSGSYYIGFRGAHSWQYTITSYLKTPPLYWQPLPEAPPDPIKSGVWYKVEDQLPINDREVLVCVTAGANYLAYHEGIYWHESFTKDLIYGVTHWIIPQPPPK